MALPNSSFDQLASTTLKNYQSKLVDNVSNHIPFMKYMKMKGAMKEDGGSTIVMPIIYDFNNTANSYSKMETLDTTEQEGISAVEYNWKQVSVQVSINGLDRTLNAGKQRVINLLEGKMKQAELSLENKISTMLFGDGTGNSGKDLLGLEAIIKQDPTTGTLGGVNSATSTFWRNYASTSVGSFATNGLTAMSTAMRTLTRGGDRPDLIVTGSTIFGYLETVANGRAQFLNPKLADLGFQALKFEGVDVIFDSACPSDRMYFINTEYLKLAYHPDKFFSVGKFIEPANADGTVAKILFYGQLVTDRREAHGVLSGISA